jgi:MFS transporter, DHA3 family, macrolide efflux protein
MGQSVQSKTGFGPLCAGSTVSQFGTELSGFAVAIWLYEKTRLVTTLSIVALSTTLAVVLIAPIAGVLVDRWNRRRLLIIAQVVGATAVLALLWLFYAYDLNLITVCTVKGLSMLVAPVESLAFQTIVSTIVPAERYGRAIGILQTTSAIVQISSPVVAGIMLVHFGLPLVLVIDFCTFGVAIAAILMSRIPDQDSTKETESSDVAQVWRDFQAGLRYVNGRSGLILLLGMFAVMTFVGGIVSLLFRPLVLFFSTVQQLGTILSIGGLGFLFGGVAVAVWDIGRKRRIAAIVLSFVVSGVCMIVAGMRPSIVLVTCSLFVFSFCSPVLTTCVQAFLIAKVAPEYRGRILSLRTAFTGIAAAIAPVIAGPLADNVFEPALRTAGTLSNTAGRIIGVGPGRGIGCLFVLAGVLCIALAAGAAGRAGNLEQQLPDWNADSKMNAVGSRAG